MFIKLHIEYQFLEQILQVQQQLQILEMKAKNNYGIEKLKNYFDKCVKLEPKL